ncbi:unnamed protein product [Ectocarpus sp. CCAP 1310/34]|nr:unnamed protein product [Ectocarpus sp. CCAP 1310/34]
MDPEAGTWLARQRLRSVLPKRPAATDTSLILKQKGLLCHQARAAMPLCGEMCLGGNTRRVSADNMRCEQQGYVERASHGDCCRSSKGRVLSRALLTERQERWWLLQATKRCDGHQNCHPSGEKAAWELGEWESGLNERHGSTPDLLCQRRAGGDVGAQSVTLALASGCFFFFFFCLSSLDSVVCPSGPYPPLLPARRPNRDHIGGGGWTPSCGSVCWRGNLPSWPGERELYK